MNLITEGSTFSGRRAALVVAHPGHELRVHHWLEIARPVAFIFTDGSGGTPSSRISSSHTIFERTGCPFGSIRGAHSDREIYEGLLAGNLKMFTGLVDRLVDEFTRLDLDSVVGDACEGGNPSHDVCRLIIGAT